MSAHSKGNNRSSRDLRKHEIAEQLLAEIIGGTLAPGEQISERTWATRFGVAQASIREAINILSHDGFVTKESGQSAHVVNLSEEDIIQLYQVRAGLEGMAGYLAAAAGANAANLQSIVHDVRDASDARDSKALTDCDLRFHLELCRISGNSHLFSYAQKILRLFCRFCANESQCERARNVRLGARCRCPSTHHRFDPRGRSRTRRALRKEVHGPLRIHGPQELDTA